MTLDEQHRREAADRDAVDWLLRLDAADAGQDDWDAVAEWLDASPLNREAFDRAERVNTDLAAAASELAQGLAGARLLPLRRKRLGGAFWGGVGGLAAAAAATVLFVSVQPQAPAEQVYQTAKGESRELVLADGSHVHLNSASRFAVRFEKDARRVELSAGEAAFDVTHDTARPFLIAVGERDIRVVGTEFDVLRQDDHLRVTVRRGVVSVQAPEHGRMVQPVLLRAGDQLEHRAAERAWILRKVDADAAFAWKRGDLVYRDQPLADVVDDLNRYFATPVRVDGPASRLRFSGVLKIDSEEAVVRRLQGFLPLEANRGPQGVVLSLRQQG